MSDPTSSQTLLPQERISQLDRTVEALRPFASTYTKETHSSNGTNIQNEAEDKNTTRIRMNNIWQSVNKDDIPKGLS